MKIDIAYFSDVKNAIQTGIVIQVLELKNWKCGQIPHQAYFIPCKGVNPTYKYSVGIIRSYGHRDVDYLRTTVFSSLMLAIETLTDEYLKFDTRSVLVSLNSTDILSKEDVLGILSGLQYLGDEIQKLHQITFLLPDKAKQFKPEDTLLSLNTY